MKPLYGMALALLASACTYNSGDSLMQDSQLHLPLVYQPWQMAHYNAPDGAKICALSTGYHGLTVLLRGQKDGSILTAVKGNITMEPGTTLRVDVDGQRFETDEEFFARQDARALAEALMHGDKAYLEWSDPHMRPGTSTLHVDNILKLEHFGMQLGECRKSLQSGKNKPG